MRVTILLLSLLPQMLLAQFPDDKKEKFPTYFAFRVNVLFPNNFQATKSYTLSQEYTRSTVTQLTGYDFGGLFRIKYTEKISIEAGLSYTARKFDIRGEVLDSNQFTRDTLKFTTFDIPVNALIFVKMSEKVHSNVGFGLSFLYKPSTVRVYSQPSSASSLDHVGLVTNKFGMDLNGQVGVELRTEEKGIFYLGGSVKVPLTPLFTMYSLYRYKTQATQRADQKIQGGAITLDLRYFFNNVKNKGQQPIVGPMGE